MENKTVEDQKKELISTLSPRQREYLEAVDWLFNGPRATGRTHLICAVALLHVLNGGEGIVIDHYPNTYDGSRYHTKSLLMNLADKIRLRIQVRETRNGFTVSRVPEAYEYMEKNETKKYISKS